MQQESISRSVLYEKLARAAQVRSVLTLLSAFGALCLLAAVPGVPQDATAIAAVLFFGVPLLVCWIVTVQICRRMVTCPYCTTSLWSCGSGNFKPRRMKIRDEVSRCPNCGIPIV